ncbi:MAG TPA: NUDIX hydrolase [Rhodocyclaceae bacterium]|nr:NUDIX hydrolase [Rhodocyclaceae bacterium]
MTKPEIATLNRRLGCENSRLRVYLDDVQSAAGVTPSYMVVEPCEKRDSDKAGGVAVLPVRDDGAVGLLRVFRYAIGEEVWEVPRGFLDPDESPAGSAAREVEEELGIACDADSLMKLGVFLPEAGILRVRIHLYAAVGIAADRAVRVSNEMGHRGFSWFPWEVAQAMALDAKIEDGASLAAMYRYSMLKAQI